MKLYATTTSERASKGQGGEYLNIEVTNEDKESILIVQLTKKDLYIAGANKWFDTIESNIESKITTKGKK